MSALGDLRDPAAVAPLIQALRDRSRSVRAAAASALGRIRPLSESATAALVAALRDPSPTVRRNAAAALGSMRDATAVAALAQTLRDDEPAVRHAAASALASIRTPEALDVLRAMDPGEDARLKSIRDRALGRRNMRI